MATACTTVVMFSGCVPGGSAVPPANPIHIGVDLPLTGPEGPAGLPALNGIRFFVRQHPQLDGFNVSIVSSDDAGGGPPSPELGAANLRAFVADPALLGVIGPFDSAVARAEIPVANAAALAMVSPAAGSTCLTREDYLPAELNPRHSAIACQDAGLPPASELRPTHVNNFFRLAPADDLQGPAAADYAVKTLHVLRAAVVSDHEAYGQALAAGFTSRFEKLGGSVVGSLDFDPKGSTDATAFLRSAKADGAAAVYFGGVTAGKGCVIRSQMEGIFDLGEATPYLGSDGIAKDPACVRDASANASGIYATVPGVDTSAQASAEPILAAFKLAFGRTGDYGRYTLVAYDATAVLYAAIDRAIKAGAGLPQRGNVVSQLSVTSGFAGATGKIGFDPYGDTDQRLVSVYEAAVSAPDGAWRLAGTVDYSGALPY